jgi:hypothetical protein
VFDKNRDQSRESFLTDKFIKDLWPTLRGVPKDLCFKKTAVNDKMKTTYCEMTRIIEKKYKLRMPEWWRKSYPAPKE